MKSEVFTAPSNKRLLETALLFTNTRILLGVTGCCLSLLACILLEVTRFVVTRSSIQEYLDIVQWWALVYPPVILGFREQRAVSSVTEGLFAAQDTFAWR
jgi:hypothetical protein